MADVVRAVAIGVDEVGVPFPVSELVSHAASCGGADMTIRYEQGQSRAVDTETGEYFVTKFWHYQHPTRDYSLYAPDDRKIFTATVRQDVVDVSPDGHSGTYKIDVLRLTEFHPDGSASVVTDERSPIADKFSRFLRVFLLDHPGMQAGLDIEFHLETGEIE